MDEMIEVRTHLKDASRTWKTGRIRVYVSGYDEPTWDHPPYSRKGDDPENDRAWKKFNREEVRLMREVLDEAIAQDPALGEKLGRVVFSKKAGCSCGCSPGFIAEGRSNEDMWIERRPDAPAFQVGDLVQHTDGREGEVTFAGSQVVVKFDEETHKRYFAWNLAVAQLTKNGTAVPDPNEAWLKAGA